MSLTKAINASPLRLPARHQRPGLRRRGHLKMVIEGLDVGVKCLKMHVRGYSRVLQGHHSPNQTRKASCALSVTNDSLDGHDIQLFLVILVLIVTTVAEEGLPDGFSLLGISSLGSGSVGMEELWSVLGLANVQASTLIHITDKGSLGHIARHSQAWSFAVLKEGSSARL